MVDSVSSNIDSITVDIVSEIQRNLHPYDLTSLIFLLYDTPFLALEHVKLLQRVSVKNLDSLYDWAKQRGVGITWKYEFLEALSVCQLHGVIRKLGFDVDNVKSHFLLYNENGNTYLNPMKRALYKLCEQMTSELFLKFKNKLAIFDIEVGEYVSCEQVLLKLMCEKFIIIRSNTESGSAGIDQVEQLVRIVENLSKSQEMGKELRDLLNRRTTESLQPSDAFEDAEQQNHYYEGNFKDLAEICENITDEDMNFLKYKTDAPNLVNESYPIFNKRRVGVCCIINQNNFFPSKISINMNLKPLENRDGSNYDTVQLINTMESYNFEVIVHRNLRYDQIFTRIGNVIKYVSNDDSIFMLCLLSHGSEGCIYSSDSIPVQLKDIKNMLDSADGRHLFGKPKVLVVEACRGTPDEHLKYMLAYNHELINNNINHIKHVDFLTFYATIPESDTAYINDKLGSTLIQALCQELNNAKRNEQLIDIFHKMNNKVVNFCKERGIEQVLVCETTLRKKLYLKLPY